jgi:hypothetical protein
MPTLAPSISKLVIRRSFRTTVVGREVGNTKHRANVIAGHYIENTSETEDLVWIELYKSDRVADIPLTQWLALTPSDIVANVLKLPLEFVENLKTEKQLLIEGR